MKRSNLLALGFAAMLTLSFGLSLADDPRASVSAGERSWRTAPRHSAGIAPDPVAHAGQAIVQVYAAPTYGWRGYFAVHPWIIYKRSGETAYTRYEVVGWGGKIHLGEFEWARWMSVALIAAYLAFFPVAVVIGLTAGILARYGWFSSLAKTIVAGRFLKIT